MKARIKIDINRRIARTDERLFGSFIEHMGRAVYTGIYEPEHPKADEHGFRKDVMELVRPLNLPLIRYPGGNFLSGYRWEDGIGPVEKRPVRPDLAWQAIEPNKVGTDEFISFCEKVGTVPMMGVNLGTGTPQDAANLVEYCNFPAGTYYSDKRAENGHAQPYNVKLWCLGNEMDGPWQICAKTAEEYAAIAREAGKMMKLVDPSIELVACGSSYRDMPTFGTWERTVLRGCWEQIDYLSLHQYYQNLDGDIPSFLARSIEMDSFISEVADICREIKAEKRSEKDVFLSFDEWNVWYHWQNEGKTAPLWETGRAIEEEEYNFADALLVGCMMNTLINHADTVKIACLAQLINALGAIMTEPKGKVWAQTIYYPFALASQNARGMVLRTENDCPTYSCAVSDNVPYIDSASVLTDEGDIVLLLVNRNLNESVELEICADGFVCTEHIAMFGHVLTAVNTAENSPVKPVSLPVNNTSTIEILSASWNLVRLRR